MKKIYLAGPEVFFANALEMGAMKKALCEKYGFKGMYPLDKELDLSASDKKHNGIVIAKANESTIREADYVIANMTPFRGVSADVGTAYEMGFAQALGKPIFAYSNDSRNYLTRHIEDMPALVQNAEGQYVDSLNMHVEDFDLTDNLMLDNAAHNGVVLHQVADPALRLQDLTAFEQCLQQLAELDKQ